LRKLKDFNIERIYKNPDIKRHTDAIRQLFVLLFGRYCDDIDKHNQESVIYRDFLADKSDIYIQSHKKEEMVRDFIAGMTDRYFLRQCPPEIRQAMTDQ
jgi:dGTPase